MLFWLLTDSEFRMKNTILLFLFLTLAGLLAQDVNAQDKKSFYYEGDGKVLFSNKNNGIKNDLPYRNQDGTFNRAGLDQINKVMGVVPAQTGEDYSLRLIAFLDYLQDIKVPGKVLTISSGYRSPKFNSALRKKGRTAGETSYHIDAMAADIILPGYMVAQVEQLWEELRHLEFGGVGMYGGTTLHLDSGRPRFWTKQTALPKDGKPQENKNIYLSIEKDFYEKGEKLKMFFSGISQYPIGVKKEWRINNKKLVQPVFKSTVAADQDCLLIKNHQEARQIEAVVPDVSGRVSLEVSFCGPEYGQMPKAIQSRAFEVQ